MILSDGIHLTVADFRGNTTDENESITISSKIRLSDFELENVEFWLTEDRGGEAQ